MVIPAPGDPPSNQLLESAVSALLRLRYWIYSNAVEKKLSRTVLTSLNLGKLLKILAAKPTASSGHNLSTVMRSVAEFEIDVHLSEAHMQYTHVVRKASGDSPVELVRREAKKAGIAVFLKANKVRAGSPEYYEKALIQFIENNWEKDKMIISALEGKPSG